MYANNNDITNLVPVLEPNQVTEPTIKNYGGNFDPFIEVHKEPVFLMTDLKTQWFMESD